MSEPMTQRGECKHFRNSPTCEKCKEERGTVTEPACSAEDLRAVHKYIAEWGNLIIPDALAAEFSRIRSESRAGMREACAGHIPVEWHGPISGVCACSCGWHSSLKISTWYDHMHIIPDHAADEAIERIKAEAERKGRIEEAKRQPHEDTYEGSCGVHMSRFCSTCRRIAALEGKEPSHD